MAFPDRFKLYCDIKKTENKKIKTWSIDKKDKGKKNHAVHVYIEKKMKENLLCKQKQQFINGNPD